MWVWSTQSSLRNNWQSIHEHLCQRLQTEKSYSSLWRMTQDYDRIMWCVCRLSASLCLYCISFCRASLTHTHTHPWHVQACRLWFRHGKWASTPLRISLETLALYTVRQSKVNILAFKNINSRIWEEIKRWNHIKALLMFRRAQIKSGKDFFMERNFTLTCDYFTQS